MYPHLLKESNMSNTDKTEMHSAQNTTLPVAPPFIPPTEPILKLNLGENGTFSFYSDADIEAWKSKERSFFVPLLNTTANDPVCTAVANHLTTIFRQIDNYFPPAINRTPAKQANKYTALKSLFENHFASDKLPTVTRPEDFSSDSISHTAILLVQLMLLPIFVDPIRLQARIGI